LKKRVVSIALFSTMTLSTALAPATTVFADDYDTQIQNKNNEIANIQSQEADAQANVDAVQGQIDSITQKMADLKAENEKLEAANKVLQTEVANLNTRIIERNTMLENQARNIQTNGTGTNILDVLLNADSLTDAIARVQAMTTLTSANRSLLNEQKKDLETLQEKVAENARQTKTVWDNQDKLKTQEQDLNTQQAELKAAQLGLAATRATTEAERDALVGQQQEAKAEAERVAAQQKEAAEKAAAAREQAAKEAAERAAQDEAQREANEGAQVPTPSPGGNTGAGTGEGNTVTPPGSASNPYPAGQCTAYVWQWFADAGISMPTFRGNAGDWIAYANSGPAYGTIAVFPPAADNWGYGHVAVVTGISGNQMTIAEGNYQGIWGHVRTIPISDAIGFIAVR